MLRLTQSYSKPRGSPMSAKKKRAQKTELALDTTQRYRMLPITSAQDHIQKVAQQRYDLELSRRYKCALMTKPYFPYFTNFELPPTPENKIMQGDILTLFRRKLAETVADTEDERVIEQAERFILSVSDLSLATTVEKIDELEKLGMWMLCPTDILPMIALNLHKNDDLLVHFENSVPDGHDQKSNSTWERRLGHYLNYFEKNNRLKSYTLNDYVYPWNESGRFYDKLIRPDVTQYPEVYSDKKIKYNPFTRLENASFKKVLIEAPCNLDRISMTNPEVTSNIYQFSCKPYRSVLPKLLEKMLVAGILNADENGGEILYTTRTLNPLHNEFMVEFAVDTLRQEYGITVRIENLDLFEYALGDSFEFEESVKTGSLVVPTLFKNSGPRYICKLKRVLV
jgi:hypothetical protein